jgi:hypothetical protein
MPRQSQWIQALPEILPVLAGAPPEAPVDRAAVETLFRLSPRQATRLLHRLGAERCGGALVLATGVLRARLEQLAHSDAVQFELARRQRLAARLEQARREARGRQVRIPAAEPAAPIYADPHVQLMPGQLRIDFEHPAELVERLWRLAQAAAEDWSGFEARTRVISGRRGGAGG